MQVQHAFSQARSQLYLQSSALPCSRIIFRGCNLFYSPCAMPHISILYQLFAYSKKVARMFVPVPQESFVLLSRSRSCYRKPSLPVFESLNILMIVGYLSQIGSRERGALFRRERQEWQD